MLTIHHQSLPRRRRRSPSITLTPPALCSRFSKLALIALARRALADVPGLPIPDLVAGGTLAENLSILASTMPAVAEPERWRGLAELAREMGLEGLENRPLVTIDLVESAAACG